MSKILIDEATVKLVLEALELNNNEWKSLADSGDSGYWKAEEQVHYQLANEAIAALKALAEQPARPYRLLQDNGSKYFGASWDKAEQPAQQQEPLAWVYPEGLEALKAGKPWTAYGRRQEPNNTALYLSPQPDIPPYAWVTFTPYGDEDDVWYENPEGKLLEGWTYKPLYDTTPPKRTWVDLTEVEIDEICLGDEAKVRTALQLLKEKNT